MRAVTLSFIWMFFIPSLLFSPATLAEEQKEQMSLDDVRRFSTAINQIKHYYVKPIKNKKIFNHAIQGMLSGLDPHSTYLDEDSFKELQSSTQGEFGGIGIEVTMEKGLIKVVTPLDDTPASKAGIKAGDYIVRIDNVPIVGLSLRDAVKKMRGSVGSPITLTILRKGEKKPFKKTVKREIILVKSVKGRLLDNKYAYIRLSHFQTLTAKNMVKSINKLKKQTKRGIQGLILDLRNNPGGLLDSAIETSDAFIDNRGNNKEAIIVYTKGRTRGSKFVATATPGDIINGAPIVVLINGGSASGSEIVAGALKDNNRALLIGTKTFGKGSVQTVLPLDDKTGIKLTTAFYYTPSGTSIQAKGIKPDIEVNNVVIPLKKKEDENIYELSEADLKGHLIESKQNNVKKHEDKGKHTLLHEDYQLHQALNILKGMAIAKR